MPPGTDVSSTSTCSPLFSSTTPSSYPFAERKLAPARSIHGPTGWSLTFNSRSFICGGAYAVASATGPAMTQSAMARRAAKASA